MRATCHSLHLAAAGLHPWKRARIAPVRVLHIDAENAGSQARPWLRRMAQAAEVEGAPVDRGRCALRMISEGLDVTQAADRAWLARMVEQTRPDRVAALRPEELARFDTEQAEAFKASVRLPGRTSAVLGPWARDDCVRPGDRRIGRRVVM